MRYKKTIIGDQIKHTIVISHDESIRWFKGYLTGVTIHDASIMNWLKEHNLWETTDIIYYWKRTEFEFRFQNKSEALLFLIAWN